MQYRQYLEGINMIDLFDKTLSGLFLNSGTQSRPPKEIISEVNKLRKFAYNNPTEMHVRFPKEFYQSHLSFAGFLNCHPNDLFFSHNVTESLNHFILNSKLSENGEIFIFDMEYGAMLNICKHRAEKEKKKLNIINISKFFNDDLMTEEILNEKILSELKNYKFPSGSLLIMSHVLTSNGFILPILKIAEYLKNKDVINVVDGAHAIGAFSIDFSTFRNIHFYGGNLHKWMMGLAGIGFGWINPNQDLKIDSLMIGWPNYDNAAHLDDFNLQGTARKFYLKGTIDFSSFMTISTLVKWWKEQTQAAIYQKRSQLRNILAKGLEKSAHLKINTTQIETSPLLTYKMSQKYSDKGHQIATELYDKHNLTVATPKLGSQTVLRLSPNVYNTEKEMEETVEILNLYLI
jgi:selenocysteine lyase/cysteine desulfurase